MSWPTAVCRATVGDQRHAEHQVGVDRTAPVADIAGHIACDHRALREPDEHIARQRASVVHVRHRLDRVAGALGTAVVVVHLAVGRQRIVELRGVGNGVHLQPISPELLTDRVAHVQQQCDRELGRVERIEHRRRLPRSRNRHQLHVGAARILELRTRLTRRRPARRRHCRRRESGIRISRAGGP